VPGASARKVARGLPPRVAPVRHLALSERAHDYGASGKGIARKDLERILAEDSHFEGVRERLEAASE
jgi:hypothetical protein